MFISEAVKLTNPKTSELIPPFRSQTVPFYENKENCNKIQSRNDLSSLSDNKTNSSSNIPVTNKGRIGYRI